MNDTRPDEIARVNALFEGLEPALTDNEVQRRYAYLLDDVVQTAAQWAPTPKPAAVAPKAADILFALGASLWHWEPVLSLGFRILASAMPPGGLVALASSRGGARKPAAEPPKTLEMEKEGAGCKLRARAEFAGNRLNLSIRLYGPDNHELAPFTVTLRDETGSLLVAGKRYKMGSAKISDLAPGTYRLHVESGAAHGEMAVAVRKDLI